MGKKIMRKNFHKPLLSPPLTEGRMLATLVIHVFKDMHIDTLAIRR